MDGACPQFTFEVYGARAQVRASSAELLARLKASLPPVWTLCGFREGDPCFTITSTDDSAYLATLEGNEIATGPLDLVINALDSVIRLHIAYRAPEKIFIHAGVVGWGESAILIPGVTMSGKTTLVGALVRAGASYLSDEYAVLDSDARVHPYAKPLSIRGKGRAQIDRDVAELGGQTAESPLPIGLIVVSEYQPDTRWDPRHISPAETMLELMRHTVPTRPAEMLAVLHRVVEGAIALEGPRGEADETAVQLLDTLARPAVA